MYFFKKQREEDKRMKKKVLAFLLASTMIIEPFTVASAADFSDGMGQDTVQFSDDAEDVPEVENDDVDQFGTDAVGEGELPDPEEVTVKVGENVNATFYYEYHDDYGTYQKEVKKTVISGVGDMWDYLSDGYDIDNLHENPFWKMGVGTELIIEDGVTSVGANICSRNCRNLQTLTLNNTLLKIGDNAFSGCSIRELILPDSIKSIGKFSFDNCDELTKVKLSANLKTIPEQTFLGCEQLQEIKLPDNLEVIESNAFTSCRSLENITLPSNLKKLDYGVFSNCQKLKSITLPSSLHEIGQSVFADCIRLSSLTFADGYSNNITDGMFRNCTSLSSVIIPNGVRRIEGEAFRGCLRLQEVTIGSNVDTIRDTTFNECDKLKTIYGYTGSYAETFASNKGIDFHSIGEAPEPPVPTGMKINVGNNAVATVTGNTVTITGTGETYDDCWWADVNDSNNELDKTSIKHIIVEDGITSLGDSIFYGFRKLEDVKLPTSLKSIGYGAFEKCDSLKELTIPEGVTNIGNGIINSCTSIKKISLPSTLNTIPRLIDMESTGDMQLDEIVLNDGIKTLGNYAFWNFRNLKNIIIPESVTNIGESAFHGCTALSNLTLPDSITEIAGEAFSNCVSLGKVTLPKNLTLLGNGVFENCNAEIIFPASLKCIPIMGDNAVTKVNIPEGVKIIGEDAFWACSNLKEITLPSTITSIESGAFFNTSISGFNYPQNIDNIPASAFYGTKLKEFSVPDNVTEIDDCAFYNCTDLKKITIPEFVTYIGNDVFKDCRNLVIYGKRDSFAERYAYINNIKFVSGQYKVVFKDNGRTVNTYYIDEGGSVLTPPTLKEKPGYTLSWDADYTNIQEDMVINAVWTKKDNGGGNTTIIVSPSETNKYTVTFKDRGKIVKTEKVKSGDAAEYPYINRNGYELSWDKDFSKVTANITVNAVWTVIKPNKVTSLTAEVQKNSIDLSWDRAENTDYYLVYRKATSDTEYKQIKKTTKILWTDEDVEPGTEYSYKVVGVCSVDGKKYQGADSDIVTAKIGTPQIGDVYSVGDLKYKVTGAKEVSVIGIAKEEVEIKIPSAVSISGKAYKVTSVQDKAFYQNEDIVSIAIGNNVIYIGKYAFYQCPNLETVKFGKRVSVISTCAFTQCPNLENVTLPSSIRRIGAKAFYQCTSIKVLKINGSALEYVGKKGLAVNKTVTLRLPKKVYTKYKKLIKASGVYSKTKFVKY